MMNYLLIQPENGIFLTINGWWWYVKVTLKGVITDCDY